MKNRLLALATLMTTCLCTMAQTKTFNVNITNYSGAYRYDEPVCIRLKDVKKLSFVPQSAVVRWRDKVIPCQLDDMDGDFKADELFFVADITPPRAPMTFEVTLSAEKSNDEVKPRVYTALQIRDKKDLHPDVMHIEAPASSNIFNDVYMHGMTIESELTGYRIYFDQRQNIDLYGKKYRRIELPETQFYTTAEQLKAGYGVDVLWAGQAIGCGSFKNWQDGKPANWTNLKVRSQRVVTSGPLRTVMELCDKGIEYTDKNGNKDTYDVRQYYSLYAGHRDVKVDIVFTKETDDVFCTGVQKVGVTATDEVRRGHTPEGKLSPYGIAESWGCDYPDMGKKELWGPEPIGMAVYVPMKYIVEQKEDDLNYVFAVKPVKGELHYWLTFCADKEEDGYHSAKEWFESVDKWKSRLDLPVKIKLK